MKKVFFFLIIMTSLMLLYIEKLNKLTKLRLELPLDMKVLTQVKEENTRLKYEIDQFENPIYLMELLKKPEFSHLKFPKEDEIIVIP